MSSIKLGPAPETYDRRLEQEFRNEMDKRDLSTLKAGRAIDRLLMTDRVTGITGLLTIESGVVTWTAL